MTSPDIAGAAVLIILLPILINDALDFFIPGRWERRAYLRSIKEFERDLRRRDRRQRGDKD